MTISIPKTNVVTPVSDYVCVISNASTDSHDVVSNVANYKYLGVNQYGSSGRTVRRKGEDAVKRANLYKNVILSSRFPPSERLKCISALWTAVGLARDSLRR